MNEMTLSSGNQITHFDQINSILSAMKNDYTSRISGLQIKGEEAVLAERIRTNERISKTEAACSQQIKEANAEIASLKSEKLLSDNKIKKLELYKEGAEAEFSKLAEEKIAIEEKFAHLQKEQGSTKDEVIELNIDKGLKDIAEERAKQQAILGNRVAALSGTIGLSGLGVILTAVATPFQPELAALFLPTVGAVVAQAPVLHKFDVEWRGMKNMPSPKEQLKVKETEMFPGQQTTSSEKKLAYDEVAAEEAIRVSLATERLRRAQQEADDNIANVLSKASQAANLIQGISIQTK